MADVTLPEDVAAREAAEKKARQKARDAERYRLNKAAMNAKRMAWGKANHERQRATDKRSYDKNAEKRRTSANASYQANPRKRLDREKEKRDALRGGPPRQKMTPQQKQAKNIIYQRIWRSRNRAHVRAYGRAYVKAWRILNKKKVCRQRRERRLRNLTRVRLLDREYSNRRRARIASTATAVITPEAIERLYVLQRGKCAYCRKPLRRRHVGDHIVALARGGRHDIRNLQLTCRRCNSRKHAKDPIVFAQEMGLLV